MRQFFQSGLISVIVVGLFIGWGYYNMNHVVKTDFTVSSHKVNNLKLLAISDLHMGLSITPEKLSKYVDEMNRLETPDFVFLVGDIVDERTDVSDMRSVFKSLSQLKSRNGIYYVYGNHDDIKKECEVHNIQVLEDEIKTIGNITLIGRKDASFSRKSSSELLKNVDKKNYIIVLDHQPLDMKENASNKADLQVSGHTHGGQIWPLGILQAITTGTMRYGVKKIDQFYTVTTSGIAGWGYPIKTGAPSEYAYITVK
ncbi:metallophosphoesterase [Eggerthia catenaformis]|nr:metallophosphoesterase [Eggerthia catenaformis]